MLINNQDFEIEFTKCMKQWRFILVENLIKNKIKCKEVVIDNICESMKQVVFNYLNLLQLDCKYNKIPRASINKYYEKYGLRIKIKSNRLLWLYLTTFTDITDFTKCFSCYIDIIDKEKLLNNVVFLPYESIIYGVIHNNTNPNMAYIQGIRDALSYYHNDLMGEEILKELGLYEA